MKETGFFLLFAGLIIALFVMGGSGGGLSSGTGTSTPSAGTGSTAGGASERTWQRTEAQWDTTTSWNTDTDLWGNRSSRGTHDDRTDEEIQAELERLYDEAWELEQKVDSFLRRQPESRYADRVRLTRSAATSRDPDREYLTLTVNRDSAPVNISGWYVESYVTERAMAIPEGTQVYKDGGVINRTNPIVLRGSERAYLITGDSPLSVSFQENRCIGYLDEDDVYPRLTRSCEDPDYLMERYADIPLDDDSCYAFVSRIGRCEAIEYDDPRLDDLSGRCRSFVRDYLNYNSCVEQFSWRTDFHDPGDWYVYFGRNTERWRQEREIIRLMDQFDRVVAVIEY